MTISETQPLPAPVPEVNPETEPFWAATARGELLVKQCEDCASLIWYPRSVCPDCGSLRTRWQRVSGRGRVYSYTVNYRGEGQYRDCGPYVLAYVELDEGPRLMTNLVAGDDRAGVDSAGVDSAGFLGNLAVGLPVEVVFHDTGAGSALPRFRPQSQ